MFGSRVSVRIFLFLFSQENCGELAPGESCAVQCRFPPFNPEELPSEGTDLLVDIRIRRGVTSNHFGGLHFIPGWSAQIVSGWSPDLG